MNINNLYTIGQNMYELNKLISGVKNKIHEENLDNIKNQVLNSLEDGDAVLVKGSNSINLNSLVNKIVRECKKI